jgi:DNA-binding winged helix-turn-helix (wHTH) protein/tetratricopeptide (TPR) repeat protein
MPLFPPFRLDKVNQVLWRQTSGSAEEQVVLNPKAFALLQFLIENSGRLVTHDELLDALWPDVHVQPEVIKSHVLTIRTALGDTPQEARFIETVRKRGYRFVAALSDSRVTAVTPEKQEHTAHYVGRSKPLRQLQDAFTSASQGVPQLVFIVGEPGIGKSALLDAFSAAVGTKDRVLWSIGRCIEGYGGIEPFYPVLEALTRLARSRPGDSLVQSLVAIAPTWAVQLPGVLSREAQAALQQQVAGSARPRMVREFCEWVEEVVATRPLILVLEDLHTSDYSTVDLLSALARRGSRARLLVIATYRPEEAAEKAHPIHTLSRGLLLQKLCREVILAPLSEADVSEYVAGPDGGRELRQLATLIAEQSGGNPLFMVAIFDDLVERGLVTPSPSGWQLHAPVERIGFEVPRTLNQLIETRIQRLAPLERRLLETASVAGMEFGTATSAPAAELDAHDFEDSCEDLSRRGAFIHRAEMELLPDNVPMQLYGFNHGMYRQVLYGRQGVARRARLHRAIGERFEEIYPPDQRGPIAVELAQHFSAAHEWLRALSYLRSALRAAKRRSAHHEALGILDRMVAIAANLPADARPGVDIECLEERAPIYVVTHDPRVQETYARLVEMAARQGRADIQIRALLNVAYALSWGDRDSCLQALDEALRLSAGQSAGMRALIQIRVSVRRVWVAGWNEVDARRWEEALGVLRASSDKPATAAAMLEYSMACLVSSRYREAIETFRRNHEFLLQYAGEQSEFNVSRASWMNLIGIAWLHLFVGELGNSLAAFDAGIAGCRKEGNYAGAQTLGLWRCMLLFQLTDYEGVLEVCRGPAARTKETYAGADTLARVDASDSSALSDSSQVVVLPFEERLSLVMCGLAEAGLGNYKVARDYLLEAERKIAQHPVMLDWYMGLMLEWGRVNLLSLMGSQAEAAAGADRFVRLAADTAERTWQALASETWARVALGRGAFVEAVDSVQRALAATEGFETPLADWRVHTTAAAAYGAAGNPQLATRHADLGAVAKRKLAESLPPEQRLRRLFEASARVFPPLA